MHEHEEDFFKFFMFLKKPKFYHFQFCYQEGGELVTIMDDSKQHEVKQFVKNLASVLDGSTPTLYENMKRGSYFWIGMHSYTN